VKPPKNHFRNPAGQVLLATLVFCFIFIALFAGLYRAGLLYGAKTRVARSADLTVLSGGAVYANGLQCVRYANVLLVCAMAVDMVKMAVAALSAGGLTGGGGAVPAAWAADKVNLRKPLQSVLDAAFGVEKPTGFYPIWIAWETSEAAFRNNLKPFVERRGRIPVPPVLLYNLRTSHGLDTLVPNMALRFRTGADLLKELEDVPEEAPLYVTTDRHSGHPVTFTADLVQPCDNSQHTGQMCVKSGIPGYSGQYCREIGQPYPPDPSPGPVFRRALGKAKWALKALKPLLEDIRLDITHRDDPPCHTLTLYGPARDAGTLFHQTSEVRLLGKGLAAWDVGSPRFQCALAPVEYDQLPFLQQFTVKGVDPWDVDRLQDADFLKGIAP
jgi:hypothetical protein